MGCWLLAGVLVTVCVEGAEEPEKTAAGALTHWHATGVVLNEEGKPVAGAKLVGLGLPEPFRRETTTNGEGEFDFELPKTIQTLLIEAHREGSEEYAYSWSAERRRATAEGKRLEMVLRPRLEVPVQVVDGGGKPVEGATVEVVQSHFPVGMWKSDREGRAQVRLSPENSELLIQGMKGGVGYDYFFHLMRGQVVPLPVVPSPLVLKLGGARKVRLNVKDSRERPVAGMTLKVMQLSKKGKGEAARSLASRLLSGTTDAQGVVTLDWIPLDLNQEIRVESLSKEFSLVGDPRIPLSAEVTEVPMMVVGKETIEGRVVNEEGKPVPKVSVMMQGEGHFGGPVSRQVTTNEEGKFEASVPAEAVYAIVAEQGDMVGQKLEVVVREGGAVRGLEFKLVRGTVITGKLTQGESQRARPKEVVFLTQNCGYVPDELRPEAPRGSLRHTQSYRRLWLTDKNGAYRFVVGPGTYELSHAHHPSPIPISVRDQKEVTNNFHQEWEEIPYAGKVVGPDGKPVAQAMLRNIPTFNRVLPTFTATTTTGGRFQGVRVAEPMRVHITSRDGKLGLMATVDREAEESTFELQPLASARGRLVDLEGKPVADHKVEYHASLPMDGGGRAIVDLLQGEVKTDAEGKFVISGLVVGSDWEFGWQYRKEGFVYSQKLQTVAVVEPGEIDLGDVAVHRPEE